MQQGSFQQNDFAKEEIKQRISIFDLVSRYVKLKRAGQNFKGLCPFHKEKTPSFIVSPSRNTFHCFGCGKGGDIYTFLQEVEGLDFKDALTMLAEETGVELRYSPPSRDQQHSSAQPKASKTRLLEIHQVAMHFYYNNIRGNTQVIEYFKGRGLKPETIRDFRLGYAPQGWSNLIDHCSQQHIGFSELVTCGLAIQKEGTNRGYDRFRDRIMFTLFDLSGKPIAFAGRGMASDAQPKYLNSPETPIYYKSRTLYGIHRSRQFIQDLDQVLVVEGYMDFLSLFQAGIGNAVATSGTALTADHGNLLKRFTANVVLVFDGDRAGIQAAERALFTLSNLDLDIKVLVLPDSEDPDSFVRKNGAERFRQLISRAQRGIDFLFQHLAKTTDITSARGKSHLVDRISPFILSAPNEIVQSEYVKIIAEGLSLSESLIYNRLDGVKRGNKSPYPAPQEEAPIPQTIMPPGYINTREGNFMRLILHSPELIPEAKLYITPETFTEMFSNNLYSNILTAYDENPSLTDILDKIPNAEFKSVISALQLSEGPTDHAEEDLMHTVIELQKKFLRFTLQNLTQQLKKSPNDRTLLQKHKELSLQLNELKKA